MIEFYINVAYCKNYMGLTRITNGEKEMSPQTNAFFFLMFATGIYRFFDKPSVYEFLSRMAIILKHEGIVDNFFSNDSLFVIQAEEYKYTMTLKDLEDHLGLEIRSGFECFGIFPPESTTS